MNAQPAGWYTDPNDATQFRYWDGSAWTEHRSPRSQAPTPAYIAQQAPVLQGPTGKWYFVISLASIGVLASVPFFHAASRLDRPSLRKTGASMAAGGILGFALIGISPEDETGAATGLLSDVGAVILLAVMVVATVLLISIRREVYPQVVHTATPNANLGAMSSVQQARAKRNEARNLAIKDPMMARELGIGRLHSPRGYDDGGLLDLNYASAQQLSEVCGLPLAVAEEVVATRGSLGRFLQVEDAIVFGQIDEEYAPMVRDRGIVIADR